MCFAAPKGKLVFGTPSLLSQDSLRMEKDQVDAEYFHSESCLEQPNTESYREYTHERQFDDSIERLGHIADHENEMTFLEFEAADVSPRPSTAIIHHQHKKEHSATSYPDYEIQQARYNEPTEPLQLESFLDLDSNEDTSREEQLQRYRRKRKTRVYNKILYKTKRRKSFRKEGEW
uniref:CCT domain-containing protein n=1 Tax=Mucochytrium quahogii TaxID=96639 RepID=A0A7S2WL26_9STRA|mmetsp:Transcript_15376/g.27049  ORF Transcript_15376/g.27049 Transcript_15376/m.27049 type:complete len:176 (+) Transcript_15376:159-686(+)